MVENIYFLHRIAFYTFIVKNHKQKAVWANPGGFWQYECLSWEESNYKI